MQVTNSTFYWRQNKIFQLVLQLVYFLLYDFIVYCTYVLIPLKMSQKGYSDYN